MERSGIVARTCFVALAVALIARQTPPAGAAVSPAAVARMSLKQSAVWRPANKLVRNRLPSIPWHGPVVYAAPTSRGEVYTYPGGTTQPTQQLYMFDLFGTASSLVVDRHADVYFADSFSTWVFEYAPGTNTPMKSFPTQGNLSPYNIALRGDDLYVFEAELDGGIANIAVYRGGKTHATEYLSDPAIQSPAGLAVDAAGNVFVGYEGANFSAGVGEFVGGQMPMKPLDVGGILPLCLAIDPSGDLLVNAPTPPKYLKSGIYIFPPPTSARAPRLIKGLPWLYQFSLTGDGKYFYAGDSGNTNSFQMYAYPSGKLVYNYQIGDAFVGVDGVAAWPAAPVGVW